MMNIMTIKRKIAFGCYLAVSLLLLGFGVRYYFCNELMPYHLAGLAVPWETLPETVRFMFVEFMHGVGAGFITTALAMLAILFVPFRKGECWASLTLPTLGVTLLILLEIMLCKIVQSTPAQPPTLLSWTSMGVIGLGALLSLCPCKNCKKETE